MALLGKDPRWYSIRSIRPGLSTTADRYHMPEVFLRASGSWKGNAMELYRKDRLPEVQACFERHWDATPIQILPPTPGNKLSLPLLQPSQLILKTLN